MGDTGQHLVPQNGDSLITAALGRIEKKLDDLRNDHGTMHARVSVLESAKIEERLRKVEETRAQALTIAALAGVVASYLFSHIH